MVLGKIICARIMLWGYGLYGPLFAQTFPVLFVEVWSRLGRAGAQVFNHLENLFTSPAEGY